LILLGVPPLGGYNYITPRRAGLSATAGLSCYRRDARSMHALQSTVFLWNVVCTSVCNVGGLWSR